MDFNRTADAEVIYQRALEYEMQLQGISFKREFEMPVKYKYIQVGTRRVDFLVENEIMVEIKAVILLESDRRCGCSSCISDELFRSLSFAHRLAYQFWLKKP